jgi:hypothetical protein
MSLLSVLMLKKKKWRVAGAIASTVIIGAGIAAAVAGTTPAGAATASAWHQVFSHHYGPANDYSAFTSTAAFGPGNVWELGGSDLSGGGGTLRVPVIVQWRGKGWTGNVAPSGVTGHIEAASADSPSDIWAVTFETGYVLHYNGTRWSVATRLPNGSAGFLTDVTAISPKNVWVFGNTGFGPGLGTFHFNGTTWQHATTARQGNNIGQASAVSGSNIWAVGSSSTQQSGEIDHFNGSSWIPASDPLLTGLTFGGIHAFTAASIWVTGHASTGPSYLLHYAGHWSRVPIPWGYSARGGITFDGKGGLWLLAAPAGSQAVYAVHWFPGNKWQRFPLNLRVDGGPVNIPGTSSVVAVGDTLAGNGSNAAAWVYGSI